MEGRGMLNEDLLMHRACAYLATLVCQAF